MEDPGGLKEEGPDNDKGCLMCQQSTLDGTKSTTVERKKRRI